MAYLYGASVQGIQSFIFKTNKLKEIIGASELVEEICTGFFEQFLKNKNITNNYKIITQAAGNIRVRFDDEDDIKKVVKYFPQAVMLKAYGISITQAVELTSNISFDNMKQLEERLMTAKNRPQIPLDLKLNIIQMAPRTGKAVVNTVKYDGKDIFIDQATDQKINESNCANDKLINIVRPKNSDCAFADDMQKIANDKNKIAVIHADGNGFGMLFRNLGDQIQNNEKLEDIYKEFSESIDQATKKAIQKAFEMSFQCELEDENEIKFRPLIIGGDDITVLCDADKALEFTKLYLQYFEEMTKIKLCILMKKYGLTFEKLTACAGITYCNQKFPFHYAVDLAESLCFHAKQVSKDTAKSFTPSSIMFHNTNASFYTTFSDCIENELEVPNYDGTKPLQFDFGPYYLDNSYGCAIEQLIDAVEEFKKDGSPSSKLREWLKVLYYDKKNAELLSNRIAYISESKAIDTVLSGMNSELKLNNLIIERTRFTKKQFTTPIYDILQLISVTGSEK